MLLHPDPSLAEVPGFTKEQLDALARSVELRRQQLEKDINDYIKTKQDELRDYGQEVRLLQPLCHRFHRFHVSLNAARD